MDQAPIIRDVTDEVRSIELAWIHRGERCFSRSFDHRIARDNM
jgi:hypothetical protein